MSRVRQAYTYRVLQTIEMKLIVAFVWAERALSGNAETALNIQFNVWGRI